MIKVRSILHKDEVIEVEEDHYYTVLARSHTWELVPEDNKPCQPSSISASKTVEESVPLLAEVSMSDIVSLVGNLTEATPNEKRKPGRPKQIK